MYFNTTVSSYAFLNNMKLGSSPEPSKNNDPLSNACTSTYQVIVSDFHCYNVTFTWVKYWTGHFLTLKVKVPFDEEEYRCEISLQSYLFRNNKGCKTVLVGKREMNVFWDLRSAKYSGGPQPCSGYYIALVSDNVIVLLLGDLQNRAVNETQAIPSSNEAQLIHATQNVYGKNEFSAKITLAKVHDISIKSLLLNSKEPEMWISVDGALMVRITNLNWRFRGNVTVILENMKLNILWDVHDWLFNGLGQGLFIFESSTIAEGGLDNEECQNDTLSEHNQLRQDSCFFLYAWKTD